MKSLSIGLAFVASLMVITTPAPAADKPTESPAGPKNDQGLSAVLVNNTATYMLDSSQSGKDFRAKIQKAKDPTSRIRLPKPPAVDMVLRITNTTDADVTITTGGDDSRIELKLEGDGAITCDNMVAMTMEFRMGTPVKIAKGKSYDVKISSLSFGMRGISQLAFWTEPGEYTLTATLVYPDGEKQTKVTSGALKLKVEADKAGG